MGVDLEMGVQTGRFRICGQVHKMGGVGGIYTLIRHSSHLFLIGHNIQHTYICVLHLIGQFTWRAFFPKKVTTGHGSGQRFWAFLPKIWHKRPRITLPWLLVSIPCLQLETNKTITYMSPKRTFLPCMSPSETNKIITYLSPRSLQNGHALGSLGSSARHGGIPFLLGLFEFPSAPHICQQL